MNVEATIFPENKHERLAQLDLTEAILQRAIAEAAMSWANCSEHHPPSYSGYVFWGEAVRVLRDELAPFGWRAVEDGVSLVVNEMGDIAILVESGDGGTGDPRFPVSTLRGRGPKTSEQVQLNAGQLKLFATAPSPNGTLTPLRQFASRQNWMLLHRRDLSERVVHAELSLPVSVDADGRPDGWHERIILDAVPLDDMPFFASGDGPDGLDGVDFDIPVERRG